MRPSLFILAPMVLFTACVPRTLRSVSYLTEGVPYEADAKDDDVLLYRNPAKPVTAYSKFLIDPVKIISNEPHAIRPEDEAVLSESFRQELINSLKDGYDIVDKPGPGVLRIRTAIQDIQPAHVSFDEEKFLVLRLDTLLARVAMELECVDSLSGERAAALIHTLREQRYFEKDKTARLLNVRTAFHTWTQELRARFDEAKTKSNQ